MAKKSDGAAAPKPKRMEIRLGEPEPDTLRAIGGSKSDRFNNPSSIRWSELAGFRPGSRTKIAAGSFSPRPLPYRHSSQPTRSRP